MALHIQKVVEPVDKGPRIEPLWVRSQALDQLKGAIDRYVRREIRGRSFLIAGHRGSGKSSTVERAVQEAQYDHEKNLKLPRPLLVRIHGPNMLRPESFGWGLAVLERDANLKACAEIALALHRALCDELVRSYGRAASANSSRLGSQAEELTAELALELDGEPQVQRLRLFWERIDALETGVLGIKADPRNSGYWELVALSTAIQVRSGVSKESRHQQELSSHLDQSPQKPAQDETIGMIGMLGKAMARGGQWVYPVVGFIVGLISFSALSSRGIETAVAFLVATAAAVIATVILNLSGATADRSSLLTGDSHASYERMLLVFLERVREAGLHPIFLVDELDKLGGDINKRMRGFMERMKYFAADHAFFCFLVDRRYFEEIALLRRDHPHPVEETFFSEDVFIFHTPRDLHLYLDRLIETDAARNARLSEAAKKKGDYTESSRTEHLAGVSLPYRVESRKSVSESDRSDCENRLLLKYILMFRSKLHAGEMRRYLSANIGDGDRILIEPGDLKHIPSYRFRILIQVAVEYVLEDDALRSRLRQDPDSSQQVYDALYYPARMWERDLVELEADQNRFNEYLKQRTGAQGSEQTRYTSSDSQSLREQMGRILAYLCNPGNLRTALEKRWESPANHPALAAFECLASEGPVEPILDRISDDYYAWRFDCYGRPFQPERLTHIEFQRQREAVERAEALFDLTELLLSASGGQLSLQETLTIVLRDGDPSPKPPLEREEILGFLTSCPPIPPPAEVFAMHDLVQRAAPDVQMITLLSVVEPVTWKNTLARLSHRAQEHKKPLTDVLSDHLDACMPAKAQSLFRVLQTKEPTRIRDWIPTLRATAELARKYGREVISG